MDNENEMIEELEVQPAEQGELIDANPPKKSKIKRFWSYVNDYKRKTVFLTLPSVPFDILYSGFCMICSFWSHSLWLFIMAVYYFLLCMLRVNVLYRAARGAMFKNKRFSEMRNYRKFSRNLIFLDVVFAYAVFLIVRNNVIHDYPGILVYAFAVYVLYKVLLAVINIFKAHKSSSLTALALRKIGIVDAMVSVLALEWAFSHRNEGDLSDFARMIEQYMGILVVAIIFAMGVGGAITCIKIRRKEKKEGKANVV